MTRSPTRYEPVTLPTISEAAIQMAEEREAWAQEAMNRDRPGTAREFELTAMLLRFLANTLGD